MLRDLVNDDIEEPALSDPGEPRDGERIGMWDDVLLQDPLAGTHVPPNVRVGNIGVVHGLQGEPGEEKYVYEHLERIETAR